jgi:hypothetical protein
VGKEIADFIFATGIVLTLGYMADLVIGQESLHERITENAKSIFAWSVVILIVVGLLLNV